jgi:LuxR family transcriptional regulator, maltose regulon positive regulatory protein
MPATADLPGVGRDVRAGATARRGVVGRRALFRRLSATAPGGVALVCAPAGSGKSVLVRSWAETDELRGRVAWVSVELGERDGQRFWLSVIDALSRSDSVVEPVGSAPGFRGELVVERLLAQLDGLAEPLVLVIDDLHELRSPDSLSWLGAFLARLPRNLRVVLTTREDPRLGLHRLRLAGELNELRAPDLRFSLAETEELLRASVVKLSDGGVALLYERTEGWAAGLRLAAISLAEHPDPERFVTEFSGSERTVAGYLLAEVLERQPAEVRELLLRTSVLERVSGPLADYLTGGSGSERLLHELEDANAFVTSIDAGRSWFRYHRLFADLLQLELRRASPAIIGSLHRAAAAWHESEGYIVEAIRHAQSARDWPVAARLLADHHVDLTFDGRSGAVCELLTAFPDEVTAADAELALVFATARLLEGEHEESAAYVELAQELIGAVPEERRQRFDVLRAELKLLLARWRGDLDTVLETKQVVEAALAAQPPAERALSDAFKAVTLLNLGVAELWSWRLEDARRDLEQALALARRARRPWVEIACLGHLGIAGPWTGLSFSTGLELSEEAVKVAEAHGWGNDPMLVVALATGAMGFLWLGRFDDAERWLERAQDTLRPDGEPGTELIVHHARGLLWLVRGQPAEALESFRAAQRMQTFLADKHPYALRTQARLLQTQVCMGQLAAAQAAVEEISEVERGASEIRLAAAVIHLAASEPGQALDVLGPVIEASAPTIHPSSATTEAQVLDAVAHDQLGDTRGAEDSLERALELAEPQGIVLPFVLAPVQGILERLPRHRTAHATLRQTILDVLAGEAPAAAGKPAPLLDELSEAELRVARYLPTNLRAPEIAAELFVSTNTIRTHQRHIYVKLGAHGRAEAVARARELGLLAPSGRPR